MTRRFITLPALPTDKVAGQVWIRCPACEEDTAWGDLQDNLMVCPWCDFHFPLEAPGRLDLLADPDSFRSLEGAPAGPSRFGWATVLGRPVALATADPTTTWDGEEVAALTILATEAWRSGRPLIWAATAPQGTTAVSWPGIQAALNQLGETTFPWISLIGGACYGPVAALALQADLVIAEPGTVVSLLLPDALREAGRLPIATTRPPRELLGEGWADAVLARPDQRPGLARLLDFLGIAGKGLPRAPASPPASGAFPPQPLELVDHLFGPLFELHGDRHCEDDLALVGGMARLEAGGPPLLLLATAKGQGWHDVRRRHGGAIGCAGWRKASRLLRLAGRFELPVVVLIGTPSLRVGRGERPATLTAALGETVQTLLALPVPTVAVRLSEEDALATRALMTADRLLVPASIEAELQGRGISPEATFATVGELHAVLSRHLEELTQTYAVHGPLGRRKLLQRRRIRWTRWANLGTTEAGIRHDPTKEGIG